MSALGVDIAGVDDISPMLSLADEKLSAAQAVMTTLLHGPGKLWWARDVGYDIRQHLHRDADNAAMVAAVQQQCEADERVDTASVDVTRDGAALTIGISLELSNAETAELTLAVGAVGDLLKVEVL